MFDQLDFPKQKKTDPNILKNYIIFIRIAVIKYINFHCNNLIFNKKPDLAMFRYNNVNEELISHKKLQNIKILALENVIKLFNRIDIFCHHVFT